MHFRLYAAAMPPETPPASFPIDTVIEELRATAQMPESVVPARVRALLQESTDSVRFFLFRLCGIDESRHAEFVTTPENLSEMLETASIMLDSHHDDPWGD